MSNPEVPESAGTVLHADSIEAIQEILHHGGRFVVRSGGSKTALSTPYDGETILDLSAMAGILEYAPGEFTFTARAATPLATVRSALAEHGQYLPFDPPLVAQGATLGGTVAAGLSGPGRHRYGGVRDFLIGIRFVDGQGRLVRGGGKVVKNAAGFDLPKLFVGSLGRLGVLVELSFKVFPQPLRYATLHLALPALDAALDTVARLTSSSYDIEALDLTFDTHGEPHCHIRLGGLETTLPGRLRELQTWLGAGIEVEGDVEATFWEEALSFSWLPAGWNLVKIPVTLADIPPLEAALADTDAIRRYASGGNLAWIGWAHGLSELDHRLSALNLGGLAVLGQASWPFLGVRPGASLAARIKRVLDPDGRFLPL